MVRPTSISGLINVSCARVGGWKGRVVRLLQHKKATEHRDACRMILCGCELGCLLHGVKSVAEAVLKTRE
jgi:hypothetical protein